MSTTTLQSIASGQFVGAQGGGGSSVTCNAPVAGPWETFDVLAIGDRYAFRAFDGVHFLGAQADGRITCNATVSGLWERFGYADGVLTDWQNRVVSIDGQSRFKTALDVPLVSSIRATGSGFVDGDYKPWTWAMCSGFRAKERVQLGENIEAFLDEVAELGANGIRVLDDAEWFRIHSSADVPRALDAIRSLADLLKPRGLHGQYCVFADWRQTWGGNLSAAQNYAEQVYAVLREYPGWIAQLVNEGNQHNQNFPNGSFAKPAGLLFSYGSNGAGDNPPEPFGDYCDLGSERKGDFALSTATLHFAINGYAGEGNNPGFSGTHRETVASEPPGFAEDFQPGRRTNDQRIAYLMGVGTRWGDGGTAHGDDLIEAVPQRPKQKECTRQFLRGVKEGHF